MPSLRPTDLMLARLTTIVVKVAPASCMPAITTIYVGGDVMVKEQEKLGPSESYCECGEGWSSVVTKLKTQMLERPSLNVLMLGKKAAIKGSADELNRGYFADMSELKMHRGKIRKHYYYPVKIYSVANKIIVPATSAVKFPEFEVNYSDGKNLKLPVSSNGNGNVTEP
ncbi:mitochondrial ATPase complex subunit ATP10 [Pyrus ussuriensis x Pyrus communis]|uniref:Mitochondrial ATPase complex subunit ATP10 n=1 Tax=Pyrus ussuriensis x Pyrus communis TaxID=2448454 RepID=A0A5N5GVZ7_9ROSA|nr:mitochondrial ATPase complex subunit ATP10 [Pyrus ussuriensis x Pyrus communis]